MNMAFFRKHFHITFSIDTCVIVSLVLPEGSINIKCHSLLLGKNKNQVCPAALLLCSTKLVLTSVAQLDGHPSGDQEVAG